MKTVVLDVGTRQDAVDDFVRAWESGRTVHGNVTALLNAGVLDRTASGAIEFPYEAVKVQYLLQAA